MDGPLLTSVELTANCQHPGCGSRELQVRSNAFDHRWTLADCRRDESDGSWQTPRCLTLCKRTDLAPGHPSSCRLARCTYRRHPLHLMHLARKVPARHVYIGLISNSTRAGHLTDSHETDPQLAALHAAKTHALVILPTIPARCFSSAGLIHAC